MDFSPISLKDRLLFDNFLKQNKIQASELTFTNIFMWRKEYQYQYTVKNGLLCIVAVPEKKEPFAYAPIGNQGEEAFRETVSDLKQWFQTRGWPLTFQRVTEPDFFKGLAAPESILPDRDSSDYIYRAEDLIKLGGKKFDGKRNHISRFKKEHSFEYVPLTSDTLEECARITRAWCEARDCEKHKALYHEMIAIEEMLENFSELGYSGALIRVDGRFEAFTTGEMLNEDTAVIHIEKASNINGLYTLINQQFCENHWKDALYINREQDLGIEGLRKAKLSYNPVRLVDKYTITLR